jgi:UDP-N-acetylmuramoyl-tripeptide--D-alanyl-D-alanine ligase
MRWTPEELALAVGSGGRLRRAGSRGISTAFIDSRTPRPDGLFVPLVAARDGHDFIPAAVQAGASAVLVQRGRPSPEGDLTVIEVDDTLAALTSLARSTRAGWDGPVVSITGSNGKTTTRAMVQGVLESGFDPVLSTRGNFNNHIGLPLSVLDTPHEPAAAVLELGMSAPGENDHLASICAPTIGVITSIALEHLEFMGTLEAIAAAEAEVVSHLPNDGLLVLPSDAPLLHAQIPAEFEARVQRVGPDESADIRIESVSVGQRTDARLRLPGGRVVEVRLRTFGAHNARNAGSALAVGLHLGLDVDGMVAALEQVEPVGDRGRAVAWGDHLMIRDCYNANPGSMDVALRSLVALRDERSGPLVAVLGDMLELGPTEDALHRDVGRLAAELGVDLVLGVGPLSAAIVEAARDAGVDAEHFGPDDVSGIAARVESTFEGQSPGGVLVKASRGIALERVVRALEPG